MTVTPQLIGVVDADTRRRAAIARLEMGSTIFVPMESERELPSEAAAFRAFLVNDDTDLLGQVFAALDRKRLTAEVFAYAVDPQPPKIVDAIFTGALDYLPYPFGPEALAACLSRSAARGRVLQKRRQMAAQAMLLLDQLSSREREVLVNMADGLSTKVIAERLGISPRTVDIHRANVSKKLGMKSRAAVARVVFEAELMGLVYEDRGLGPLGNGSIASNS